MANGELSLLIEDAARSGVPVDELLRRLKVVARRARIADLEGWVQHELDGYEDAADLPKYRGPFSAHVLGHFSGPFQSHASNLPIPPSSFPEDYRQSLFQISFFEGVAELESLATASTDLQMPWPADALMLVQVLEREGKLNLNGHVLNQAHRVVPRSLIAGVLRTVRDRVLALALRLEEENPRLGEAGVDPASQVVARDVSIIVHGGQPNIAVAGHDVAQTSNVRAGDRSGLLEVLRGIGLDHSSLREFEAALDADAETDDASGSTHRGPGRRVLEWLGKLSLAAGGAAGATMAQEAGRAIGHFFG